MEAPLEELAAWFARWFGQIDIEKSDVVVGMALCGFVYQANRQRYWRSQDYWITALLTLPIVVVPAVRRVGWVVGWLVGRVGVGGCRTGVGGQGTSE